MLGLAPNGENITNKRNRNRNRNRNLPFGANTYRLEVHQPYIGLEGVTDRTLNFKYRKTIYNREIIRGDGQRPSQFVVDKDHDDVIMAGLW